MQSNIAKKILQLFTTRNKAQRVNRKVFISYTGRDLTKHADNACAAAETAGWKPIDHRKWAPNGYPSVAECRKHVAACDALIVMTGSRYGWIPTRKEGGDDLHSITYIEVIEARSRGIAVIPLLLQDKIYEAEVIADPQERSHLDKFRNDLKSTIVRFFTEDPLSVNEPVILGLKSWDGRKNDAQMPWRRSFRIILPLVSLVTVLIAWLTAGPSTWANWAKQPQLSDTAWFVQPMTLFVLGLGILLGVIWTIYSNRGRPQLIYRLFPLSNIGDTLLLLTTLAGIALAYVGLHFFHVPDPLFEKQLESYIDPSPNSFETKNWNSEYWKDARYEEEINALRSFVTPVNKARESLSSKLAIADVKKQLSKINTLPSVTDSRVKLLVDIARFEDIAITQDAGHALTFYEKSIKPRLDALPPILRAEAKNALARWIDYWAFTNQLQQINRTGAPQYTEEQVINSWNDVLAEVPSTNDRPSWVRCAAMINRNVVLHKLCGVTGKSPCNQFNRDLREALECAQTREDKHLARIGRINLATWLMAIQKYVEAFRLMREDFDESGDLLSGLYALGMQKFNSVVPSGQEIDPNSVRARVAQEPDLRRRTEFMACLDLLEIVNSPSWSTDTRQCRIASTCLLTDNPAVNQAFCAVPEPKINATVPLILNSLRVKAILGSAIRIKGEIVTTQSASEIIDECDGDVEGKPTVTVHIQNPGRLVSRVYSNANSVLLVRGPGQTLCSNDSPLPGDYKTNKDAGVIFNASIGDYEFFVGRYGSGKLDFELHLSLIKP